MDRNYANTPVRARGRSRIIFNVREIVILKRVKKPFIKSLIARGRSPSARSMNYTYAALIKRDYDDFAGAIFICHRRAALFAGVIAVMKNTAGPFLAGSAG